MPGKRNYSIGDRYNKLTIISSAPSRKTSGGNSRRQVYVRCDCGTEMMMDLNAITSNNTKSCGCSKLNMNKKNVKVYNGERFGMLTVIKELPGVRKKCGPIQRYMECQCDCGNIKNILLGSLKSGKTTSCGCFARKNSSEYNSLKVTIGQERDDLVLLQELDKVVKYTKDKKMLGSIRYVLVFCNRCGSEKKMTMRRFANKDCPPDCGCGNNERVSQGLIKEIEVGKKYNHLTVLREVERNERYVIVDNKKIYKRRLIECVCDCGVVDTYDMVQVYIGEKRSCGCQNKIGSHGLCVDENTKRMYYRWKGMLARCYNSKSPAFKYYGARGIEVCQRWRESCNNFIEDMGFPPTWEHSLDRINVDGFYELENCRWATQEVQSMNKRNNKWYKESKRNPTT